MEKRDWWHHVLLNVICEESLWQKFYLWLYNCEVNSHAGTWVAVPHWPCNLVLVGRISHCSLEWWESSPIKHTVRLCASYRFSQNVSAHLSPLNPQWLLACWFNDSCLLKEVVQETFPRNSHSGVCIRIASNKVKYFFVYHFSFKL